MFFPGFSFFNKPLLAVFLLLSTVCSQLSAGNLLPVEAFARLPDVMQIKLSPDGTKLASLIRVDTPEIKGTAVAVFDIQQGKSRLLMRSDNQKHVLIGVSWANDKYLLVSGYFPSTRIGALVSETRLIKINIETGEAENLIHPRYIKKYKSLPQYQNNIVDFLRDDPEHILLGINADRPGEEIIYKVNIETRKQTTFQSYRSNVRGWITDRQHRARVGIRLIDKKYIVLVNDIKDDDWEERWKFEAFSEDMIFPLGFDHDPNLLYVKRYFEGREAIFLVDLSKKDDEFKLVYSDPDMDVRGTILYSEKSKKVIGVTHSGSDGYTFFDPAYEAFKKGIDKQLPDTMNYIIDMSEDERKYIILSTSDIESGVYYLGDRDKGRMEPIAYRYSMLKPSNMQRKKRLTYKTRDGLSIDAYLTLPNDKDHPHPMLIFPHGGPISRDDGGFDYWTQFFANRGYAVLQMNFRGSSGYGYDFMRAGLKNWGKEMQDDVEDGARWLIDEGIADKDRMCIVGASYGGYAALMGGIKTPELYKCVISFAGVTDLVRLIKSRSRFLYYEITREQIGNDYSELRKVSPVQFAENFEAPVLLIHGTEDSTVNVEHSQAMNKALVAAGKAVTYVELNGGTHFLGNSDRRLETFRAMEGFLARYLPVKR